MIFAAGLGTRLRPLTNDRPKALVEVSGQPMLQRVILRLKAAGVDELVINIHHFGDRVIEFMRQNHDFGLTVHISDERPLCDKPLETGGGILQARQWLEDGEPFIVHNADILTDLMVCFGCTGGQHRSVYAAQHLAEHIHAKFNVRVELTHREQDGHDRTFNPVER